MSRGVSYQPRCRPDQGPVTYYPEQFVQGRGGRGIGLAVCMPQLLGWCRIYDSPAPARAPLDRANSPWLRSSTSRPQGTEHPFFLCCRPQPLPSRPCFLSPSSRHPMLGKHPFHILRCFPVYYCIKKMSLSRMQGAIFNYINIVFACISALTPKALNMVGINS